MRTASLAEWRTLRLRGVGSTIAAAGKGGCGFSLGVLCGLNASLVLTVATRRSIPVRLNPLALHGGRASTPTSSSRFPPILQREHVWQTRMAKRAPWTAHIRVALPSKLRETCPGANAGPSPHGLAGSYLTIHFARRDRYWYWGGILIRCNSTLIFCPSCGVSAHRPSKHR